MFSIQEKERFKNIFKGLLAVLIYFSFSIFTTLPLSLFHIKYNDLSITIKEFYNFSVEIIMITLILLIFKSQIKKAWQDLKKHHFEYFKDNFKFYLLGAMLMMAANSLIAILGGDMSGNETAIRDQFSLAPIYTFISAVFLAPLLEESVFRLAFRNIFKNNFLFILTSGLIFGSLHLLGGVTLELLPLYMISYCSFGFVFAYILTKTKNIFVTIGFHMMHNGILMSLQVFLLLFN
ncbi:MAG: CPBP family intramembrane metalloprotease [Bacilli bacterium]|nr:CPBP family intramembrane metalloprotease [Bacilli bacterium]